MAPAAPFASAAGWPARRAHPSAAALAARCQAWLKPWPKRAFPVWMPPWPRHWACQRPKMASAAMALPEPPGEVMAAADVLAEITNVETVAADLTPDSLAEAVPEALPPPEIILTAEAVLPPAEEPPRPKWSRCPTNSPTTWGIALGSYNSRNEAERALLTVALAEAATLMGGVRRVSQGGGGYDAQVVGLTREAADLACQRVCKRAPKPVSCSAADSPQAPEF